MEAGTPKIGIGVNVLYCTVSCYKTVVVRCMARSNFTIESDYVHFDGLDKAVKTRIQFGNIFPKKHSLCFLFFG